MTTIERTTEVQAAERGCILVTGGEGGIGMAICRKLSDLGHQVISIDRVRARAAERGDWRYLEANLTDLQQIQELADGVPRRLAGIVNCAGILRAASALKWDDEAVRQLFDVNLFAVGRMIAVFAQRLVPGSAIVNVSSISWRLPDQGDLLFYGASKAALESFTRQCATQLGPRGVRVNGVAPGIIDVAMSDDMKRVAYSESSPLRRCALGRMGTADEIADCVEFLLRATYVNGTTLVADGGLAG